MFTVFVYTYYKFGKVKVFLELPWGMQTAEKVAIMEYLHKAYKEPASLDSNAFMELNEWDTGILFHNALLLNPKYIDISEHANKICSILGTVTQGTGPENKALFAGCVGDEELITLAQAEHDANTVFEFELCLDDSSADGALTVVGKKQEHAFRPGL